MSILILGGPYVEQQYRLNDREASWERAARMGFIVDRHMPLMYEVHCQHCGKGGVYPKPFGPECEPCETWQDFLAL